VPGGSKCSSSSGGVIGTASSTDDATPGGGPGGVPGGGPGGVPGLGGGAPGGVPGCTRLAITCARTFSGKPVGKIHADLSTGDRSPRANSNY